MTNYTYTNLYVHGSNEELDKLFRNLKRWTRKDEKKQHEVFGYGWIGFIAQAAKLEPLDLNAGVLKIQYDGRGRLYVLYISAAGPQAGFWRALVRRFAPHCQAYYLAEEAESGFYETNDTTKRIIVADYAVPARNSEGVYLSSGERRSTFYTEASMQELLSSKYGAGKPMTELLELAQQEGLHVHKVQRVRR